MGESRATASAPRRIKFSNTPPADGREYRSAGHRLWARRYWAMCAVVAAWLNIATRSDVMAAGEVAV
jgi:hypothetical protein